MAIAKVDAKHMTAMEHTYRKVGFTITSHFIYKEKKTITIIINNYVKNNKKDKHSVLPHLFLEF